MESWLTFGSFVLFLWFARSVKALLFHVYLWQLKEYRIDRLIDHFRLKSSRRVIFSKLFWMRIVFFPLFLFFNPPLQDYALLVLPMIYILELGQAFKLYWSKKLPRPVLTLKAVFLLNLSLLVVIFMQGALYYSLIPVPRCTSFCNKAMVEGFLYYIFPYLLTFFLPLIVAINVIFFKPITFLIKTANFKLAQRKIRNFPNLMAIGITGSYGKSSTKEILAEILSRKFKVLKTEKNVNSEIGVAQTVLKKLESDHQIFVVEMGAYKKGEIRTICDIVKPKIGILSAISNQHLALFGSNENTAAAKFELIESLPKDGLALINSDNEKCRELIPRIMIKKATYAINNEATIRAKNVTVDENKIEFEVNLKGKNFSFSANLLGKHNVSNILPAIYVAEYLGMEIKEIQKAVSQLTQLPKTMRKSAGKNGIILIDDSYNANPDGVIAGLAYLKVYKRKKAIIMPSLRELGKAAADAHEKIGEKIGEVCDMAIFLEDDFKENLQKGFVKAENSKCRIYYENDQKKILEIVSEELGDDAVILFESRGAERVMEALGGSIV